MRKLLSSISLFTLLSIGLGSCGGSGGGTQAVPEDVTMTFFRAVPAGVVLIRSQGELDSFWASNPFQTWPIGLLSTEPAKPVYDYATRSVIGLSLGVGKWCFKPTITSASLQGDSLVVHYEVSTASTLACLRDGPLIAFALVPRFTGTLSFVLDSR